jgi:hypothetical protein
MQIERLSRLERLWIREAIRAVAEGPFVTDDAELHTLTGLTRSDLDFVLASWETADDAEDLHALAINNCLNTLLNYPHHQEHRWHEFLSIPQSDLAIIYDKWRHFRDSRARRA